MNGTEVLLWSTPVPHEPTQNDDASFMSSQMPENSTPNALQFFSASVQYAVACSENQSGKTVYPGQTWPMYVVPSGFLSQTSSSAPRVYGSYTSVSLTEMATAASTIGM